MNYYIGIDLGTSSLKGIVVDKLGSIIKTVSKEYDVITLKENYSEQDPSLWVNALMFSLKELVLGIEKDIKGISFGGQMHGLVILDKDDNVIRPCILWNDGRTQKETKYLNNVIGKSTLAEHTGNIAFAGFTLPKILWVKENEPDNFNKISKLMLPKDYLAYYLTGVFATDYSDASGTLLLDCKNKCYSKEMLDICSIKESQLPKLYESYDKIGFIKESIAKELGLEGDVNVIIGAGDNAAAAIGTSTINDGSCNISLGTSGTIFISTDKFIMDKDNSLHSFAHANSKWHLMGCILTAASARKWWIEDILSSNDYNKDDNEIENANDSNVLFAPYLSGERCPYNDTNVRGAFLGLSHQTSKSEMSKAVMEGVTFAIRDSLEIVKENGIDIKETTLCGGGAKSKVWKQMVADVLNLPVKILKTEQGPSMGSAILAMVGSKEYDSLSEATKNIVSIKETIYPNKDKTEYYNNKYNKYKKLYNLIKDI